MSKKIKLGVEVDGIDDISKNIQDAEKSAGNLRKEFIEARKEVDRLAAADVINQDELDEAIGKMAEIKDQINDINEQVNVFASGSKYEVVSNSFGSIGKSLLSLDFGKAEQRAQSFAKAASSISFSDAIKSLKQLGSTFITVGKSLLTNPLFLIGAVIAGIAIAILKVLDNLGILKTITEAVGKVFDGVLKTIENLILRVTDFFGLTNKEAREAASALDEQAEATKRLAKATEDASIKTIQGIDQEIRIAKLQGQNTEELQRKKLVLLREVEKQQAKAALAELKAAKASGKATDEELLKLAEVVKERARALRQRNNDVIFFDKELEVQRQKEADKEVADRRATNERLRVEREKAAEVEKKLRFDTARLIEDLEIQNIENVIERELKANRVKYDRLIEDTLNNEKLLESERQAIVAQLRLQAEAVEKEIRDKQLEDLTAQETAKQDILNEFAIRKTEKDLEEEELSIFQEGLRYEGELQRLREALENEVLTVDEFNTLKEQLEEEHLDKLSEINDDFREKEKEQEKILQDQKLQIASLGFQTIGNLASLFADGSEKNAKRAFEVQKAAGIADTAINTFKSATGAFSSLSSIPVVGPALGAAAAAAATAAGLANINAIRKQKFEGKSVAAAPKVPSAVDMTPEAAPTPPSLFGDELSGSTGGDERGIGSRQEGMMRAIVVESDITNTQNRLSTYQQRSEID